MGEAFGPVIVTSPTIPAGRPKMCRVRLPVFGPVDESHDVVVTTKKAIEP